MRICAAIGVLALLLCSAPAGARGDFRSAGYTGPMGRAYASFLEGYLEYRAGNLDAALDWYRKALRSAGEDPDLLYEIANVEVKKGQLAEARKSLTRALAADPGHTRSRYLLAGILSASGERDKALGEYERVIREDPGNEEAYIHLSTLLAEQGEFARAEATLGDLIARDPDSYLGYYYRGRIEASQRKYDAALADFDKAVSIAPGFDAALMDSGTVLEILDRSAEAEERYREALRASPNNPLVRERLGRVLVREKKIDQAVGQYEELKKFSPTSTDVRSKLGLLYLEQDRFDDAIDEFAFVLGAEPRNYQVRYFLGTAYLEKGAIPEAIDAFRQIPPEAPMYREAELQRAMLLARQDKPGAAIDVARKLRERYPEDVDLMIFLGGLLEEAKQYHDALAVLTEATVKAPNNPGAWFSLGVVNDKLGRLDNVISAMETVIRLDPKNATALNYLGYTYAERDMRLDEAQRLIERALAVRPDDGFFLDSLAWVYYRKGEYALAEAELRKALQRVPDDPVVLEHLGDVLKAQGKNEEAARLYERAIARGHEKKDDVAAKLKSLRNAETPGK